MEVKERKNDASFVQVIVVWFFYNSFTLINLLSVISELSAGFPFHWNGRISSTYKKLLKIYQEIEIRFAHSSLPSHSWQRSLFTLIKDK